MIEIASASKLKLSSAFALLVLSLVFVSPEFVLAQSRKPAKSASKSSAKTTSPKSTNKKATDGIKAIVIAEGALVYAQPDFDAEVVANVREGASVVISRGKAGDMAKFHRIRVGKTLGYISENDVASEAIIAKAKKQAQAAQKLQLDKETDEEEADSQRLPIYFSRFVGLLVGTSEFKEDISGVNANTNLLTYGLKLTGPDLVFGPVMDVNLALHYGVPKYYEPLSRIKPTGFLIFADTLLLVPFTHGQDSLLYGGIGPLVVFSKFDVINGGKSQILTNLNLGLALSAGGAYRIGKVALRLEAKYLIEKESYKALQAAIQTQF